MNTWRLLVDENTPPAIRDQLRRKVAGICVLSVGEASAPSLGTLDPEILVWLERHAFCLVTHNRTSMPVHLQDHLLAGHHVLGIFVLDDKAPLGVLIDDLCLICTASAPHEYADRLTYIPLKPHPNR